MFQIMSFVVSFVAAWFISDAAKSLFSLGEISAYVLFGVLLGAINWAIIGALKGRPTNN